ncbi:MAG: MFS transporter, partial [Sphingomonas sp.]|nr:MFS transporter [Sphingomonas sp.]
MQQRTSSGVTSAFIIVTCLFFAWGFITALNDPLVAAVKGIFTLSRFEAQFVAFAFFIAYGIISFPAAVLLQRVRPMPSIVAALITMIVGCGLILTAANVAVFPLVLVGL